MSRVSHAITCVHCIVITISHLARLAIYNSPETLLSGYDVQRLDLRSSGLGVPDSRETPLHLRFMVAL